MKEQGKKPQSDSTPKANFRPHIEAVLSPECRVSIFIKAVTHGTRLIRLPEGFAERPDALAEVRRLVRRHWQWYRDGGHDEHFPIQYYTYIVRPGLSYRFTTAGDYIGEFCDEPNVAGIRLADGRMITWGSFED
ncbi:hypothetical protein [Oceanithermus sp.]